MGFSSTNRPTPFLTNPLSDFRLHHPGVRLALHAKALLALQEFTFTLLCWPGLTPPLLKHKYCHILVNTQQQFPAGVLNATTAPPRVPSHLPRTEQLKGQHLAEQAHRTPSQARFRASPWSAGVSAPGELSAGSSASTIQFTKQPLAPFPFPAS